MLRSSATEQDQDYNKIKDEFLQTSVPANVAFT